MIDLIQGHLWNPQNIISSQNKLIPSNKINPINKKLSDKIKGMILLNINRKYGKTYNKKEILFVWNAKSKSD